MSKHENKKTTDENEYKEISLFKNPIVTLQTLSVILYEQMIRFFNFVLGHKFILPIFIIFIVLNFVEGIHTEVINKI
jgi:hypothetical protein